MLLFSFFFILHIPACVFGAVLPSLLRIDGKIVGGSPVSITEVPYHVALFYSNIYTCGGSIISSTAVLTAAHCTLGSAASKWRVRIGTAYYNRGGRFLGVNRVKMHEKFDTKNVNHDICIITLSKHLILGPTVRVVSLPVQDQSFEDGSMGLVTGWGATATGGTASTQLLKISVPVVNQNDCVNIFKNRYNVTTNMICAGTTGKDACQGDSGGPMVIGVVLAGITSWGNGCASPGYPGVYTNVARYIDWIKNNK